MISVFRFSWLALLLVIYSCNKAGCDDLDWWQKTIVYQVYPRSFEDSNGDGIGDLEGIRSKADYFKDLGLGAVWLNPIYQSPMKDFGYDISNYTAIYDKFGTMDDFVNLKKKLDSLGIKLILDFVPNHSSDQSVWFQKSVKRIDPYTDYYVWKDPKGHDKNGEPIPPNNWISVFNYNPAWTYSPDRKQFYLHQFLDKQPDLNYRSSALRTEMENVIKFWLDKGVDGFRIDAVPFLIENNTFPDEAYKDPTLPHNLYWNMIHNYTMDQPETFEIIRSWRKILDDYSEQHKVSKRIMLTEAYTDLKTTMKYYGSKDQPISEVPFNFLLITDLNDQSNATDFVRTINNWMTAMPAGQWPNWVIGNHDQFRVAARYGTEMVDALNMLVTLLPGTAMTYYGEELGLENTFIRWDQTQDPQGKAAGPGGYQYVSRDGCRTPMQWDDTLDAGFSNANFTWLPTNPNYWRINVKEQKDAERSHYKVYKKLVEARATPTIQQGNLTLYSQKNWTLIFTRSNQETNHIFIVILNLGSVPAQPDLSMMNLPKYLYVYTSSVNAEQVEGDKITVSTRSFNLRPKAAVVLSTEKSTPSSSHIIRSSSFVLIIMALLIKYIS